jgi:hypothetical protein
MQTGDERRRNLAEPAIPRQRCGATDVFWRKGAFLETV